MIYHNSTSYNKIYHNGVGGIVTGASDTPYKVVSLTPGDRVATPVISCSNNTVSIACATSGASIYYTTDGTTPTASSTLYGGSFSISATVTVKAIGIKTGMMTSDMATAGCFYGSEPFYLYNRSGDSNDISITQSDERAVSVTLEYSLDGASWLTWGTTSTTPITLHIAPATKVYFRGTNNTFGRSNGSTIFYNYFSSTQLMDSGGDITTLLTPSGGLTTLAGRTFAFAYLFKGCTTLYSAPVLVPTTLSDQCYRGMFYGCRALTTAPALPATTITAHCYREMFNGCSTLTTAPALNATTMATSCYEYMFASCTALVNAPALPATTLADACYWGMFEYCRNIVNAPDLPAENLADMCYAYMFDGCTKLESIKVAHTAWNTGTTSLDWTNRWLYLVASSGTFTKPADLPEEFGEDRIPEGWTVVNY